MYGEKESLREYLQNMASAKRGPSKKINYLPPKCQKCIPLALALDHGVWYPLLHRHKNGFLMYINNPLK
jgi:hypothetical protein